MRRLTALVLGLASCSGASRPQDLAALEHEPGWIRVRDVPLVLQRTPEDCGPAALAMLLAWSETPATVDEIAEACPSLRGRGVRAGDLRDFARRKGLQAFLFEGRPEDLPKELSRGRPFIVGLVKSGPATAATHYAVVVAAHAGDGRVVTLDPADGPRCTPRDEFLREWTPSRRLILLLYREPPIGREPGPARKSPR